MMSVAIRWGRTTTLATVGLIASFACAAAEVPLEFDVGKAHLRLFMRGQVCELGLWILKEQRYETVTIDPPAPCDIMTMGAPHNFAPSIKGNEKTGNFVIRVVGNLQWIPGTRAECGQMWQDVIVSAGKGTLTLEKVGSSNKFGFCPRLYDQVHW